jgi:hypothetical protein
MEAGPAESNHAQEKSEKGKNAFEKKNQLTPTALLTTLIGAPARGCVKSQTWIEHRAEGQV